MSAAFEDTQAVPDGNPLEILIQTAIDELDGYTEELIDVSCVAADGTIADKLEIQYASDECDFSSEQAMRPITGEHIEVFRPEDNQNYAGAVTSVTTDGMCVVTYDDDETETLKMAKETWRFEQNSLQASATHVEKVRPSRVKRTRYLRSMMNQLRQNPFLWHHAQGFEQSAIARVYEVEEHKYIKTVQCVLRKNVSRDATIVSPHVV